MKTFFCLILLSFALSSFAQREHTIDDLSTIGLNLDVSSTEAHDIHYPNYRMGGGNGPGRKIRDCLLLDVRHSDAVITVEQKMKLAKALKVLEGFFLFDADEGEELKPVVKGNNVAFMMPNFSVYMTYLRIESRNGNALNAIIRENLPAVRPGNMPLVPTGLVYVRDCRF